MERLLFWGGLLLLGLGIGVLVWWLWGSATPSTTSVVTPPQQVSFNVLMFEQYALEHTASSRQ